MTGEVPSEPSDDEIERLKKLFRESETDDKETKTPSETFRNSLKEKRIAEREIFHTALARSDEYISALRITDEEIAQMERKDQGAAHFGKYPTAKEFGKGTFLKVNAKGENFVIVAKNVCLAEYNEVSDTHNWQNILMAIAEKPELNIQIGGGTSLLNIVPKEYHEAILSILKKGKE